MNKKMLSFILIVITLMFFLPVNVFATRYACLLGTDFGTTKIDNNPDHDMTGDFRTNTANASLKYSTISDVS